MEALKIMQITNSNKLTVDIPNNFVSKNLEIIIFPIDEEPNEWNELHANNLDNAYSTNEPGYELSMLKEPNIDYEKR
ncbi:MAG: hypothetical protein EBZ58_04625 [Bacteroidetes bacterium]|nr:hypothetical protein [Bacteroidota bacterium]